MKNDEAPLALRRPFVRLAQASISSEFLTALRSKVPAARIVSLLPRYHPRDPQGPWKVFRWELEKAYAEIMHKAGRSARTWKAVEKAPEITTRLNPHAKKWIDKRAGDLCVELSRQQHEVVRAFVATGYARGARPEEIAQHLKTVVGLTERQQAAVDNFADQEGVTDAQIERYAKKQLAYRVENISRTENRTAVEQGRLAEWAQAKDDGELPAGARKVWSSSPASYRLCEACEEMDGQSAALDEDFHSEDGDVDAPPLHPQCRCTMTLEFD